MSNVPSPFDRSQLKPLDQNLRKLVDQQYNLCIYKCTEKQGPGLGVCKEKCVENVIVPYRFNNHAAREDEEMLYRKCLSEKLPEIQPKDYMECSQKLYRDRVEILSKFFAAQTEKILQDLH